ncbi:UNVERIFIED_CONTAM: hypothetical protein K2H54_051112 [Gekko kuhli]
MSLPFYQRHHQHFDRGYRHKELESTLSQYQKEEKSKSAIYTHGSSAYSQAAALAYHHGSASYDQQSMISSHDLAEAYAHGSSAHSKRAAAYSLGSESISKKAEAYHLGSELVNKKAEAYRLGYETYKGQVISASASSINELPFSPSLALSYQGSPLLFSFYDNVAIIICGQTLQFFYALVRGDLLLQQVKSVIEDVPFHMS